MNLWGMIVIDVVVAGAIIAVVAVIEPYKNTQSKEGVFMTSTQANVSFLHDNSFGCLLTFPMPRFGGVKGLTR